MGTKLLLEYQAISADKVAEYKNILLLLASHGNVCHVLKEVAINNAYGMMTNNLDKYTKSQSLQQQILRVLATKRRLLVEKLHHAFKFSDNVHYIASFHDELADKLGLKKFNDWQYKNTFNNTSNKYVNWKKGLDQMFFKCLYTNEVIVECILKQIDEKKIGYQKIVAFFEEHCPEGMKKNEFLQVVIDIDSGMIDEKWMYWMLEKLEIFLIKTEEWKEIEKCWDYDDITANIKK